MSETPEEIERHFAVGRVAVLQTEPQRKDGPRFATTFVGWRRGRAVFVEHPKTHDGRDVMFRDGQSCVIRFVHDGQACAFASDILDWGSGRGEPQVRLRWPAQLERLALRRFDRIHFHGSGTVAIADGRVWPAKIVDLSIGGCGMTVQAPVAKGETLQVTFTLPGGAEIHALQVVVRMSRPAPEGTFVGCEFAPGQDRHRNDLTLFITGELARTRGSSGTETSTAHVLIADSNTDFCDKLKRLFARQQIDAVSAASTLDALHLVRALHPKVFLVSQNMADLPGLEICRLLRAARGLEDLSIMLYGGDPDLAATAASLRLHRVFATSGTLLPDLTYEVKQVLARPQAATGT